MWQSHLRGWENEWIRNCSEIVREHLPTKGSANEFKVRTVHMILAFSLASSVVWMQVLRFKMVGVLPRKYRYIILCAILKFKKF